MLPEAQTERIRVHGGSPGFTRLQPSHLHVEVATPGETLQGSANLVDLKVTELGDCLVIRPDPPELPPTFRFVVMPTVVMPTHEIEADDSGADWLDEALEELGEACLDAEEQEYPPVTELALANAKRLLTDLARRVAEAPLVHSTPEGGIAIDFRNPERDAGILTICEPGGDGVCFYEFKGKRGRIRVSDADDLLEAGGWFAIRRAGFG